MSNTAEPFAAIIHQASAKGDGLSDFVFYPPQSESVDDLEQWLDILDKFRDMLAASDHDEIQQFDISETFVILLIYDHEGSLEMSINFDVWTKSIKAFLIDEIPRQMQYVDKLIQQFSKV